MTKETKWNRLTYTKEVKEVVRRILEDTESKITKLQISRWTGMFVATINRLIRVIEKYDNVEILKQSRAGCKNLNSKIPMDFNVELEKSVLYQPVLVDHERA